MHDEIKKEEPKHNHKRLTEIDEIIGNGICTRERLNWSSVIVFELMCAVPLIFIIVLKSLDRINQGIFITVVTIFLVVSIVIIPAISIAILKNKTYHYFLKINGRTFLLDFSSKTIGYYDGNLFLNIYIGKNNKVIIEKKSAEYYEKVYFIFRYNVFTEGEFLSFNNLRLIGHADFSKYRGINGEKYGENCTQMIKLNKEGMPKFYRSKLTVTNVRSAYTWYYNTFTNKYILLNEPNFKFPLPNVLREAFEKYHLPIPSNVFDLETKSNLTIMKKLKNFENDSGSINN